MLVCVVITLIALTSATSIAFDEPPAHADDHPQVSDAAAQTESSSPEPSTRRWRFNVTPRIGIRQSTAGVATSGPEGVNFQRITLDLTTSLEVGGSLFLSPPGWSKTELVVTVLSVPSASGLYETIVVSPLPFIALGEFQATRLDVEAMMRRRIGNSQGYWLAGLEYIRLGSERRGLSIFQLLDSDTRRRTYFVKGGVGGSLDLSSSGKHQLFTDLLATIGLQTENTVFQNLDLHQSDSSAAFGFDVAAGYRFSVTKRIAIGGRYRVQGISNAAGSASAVGDTNLALLHGVELFVSLPF